MNIIITGGSGFIGSNVIRKLLDEFENINIISIDNYLSGKKENETNDTRVKYITDSTWNINKNDLYKKFNPDILYHFGEYSRIYQSFDEPIKLFESNMRGTYQVIEFCKINKCKLIYSGSSSIFGNNMTDQNLSPYAWTKAKNIELIKNYKKWYNLSYTIVYFYNVYGNGEIMEGKYATVIGIFRKQYLTGKPLTVVKPGTQSREFTHISDTVNGILLVSLKDTCDDYQITSGVSYSINDIARMFSNNIIYLPPRNGERSISTGSNEKLVKLGWKPKYDLKEYISNIVV